MTASLCNVRLAACCCALKASFKRTEQSKGSANIGGGAGGAWRSQTAQGGGSTRLAIGVLHSPQSLLEFCNVASSTYHSRRIPGRSIDEAFRSCCHLFGICGEGRGSLRELARKRQRDGASVYPEAGKPEAGVPGPVLATIAGMCVSGTSPPAMHAAASARRAVLREATAGSAASRHCRPTLKLRGQSPSLLAGNSVTRAIVAGFCCLGTPALAQSLSKQLIDAAKDNKLERVKDLLAQNANASCVDNVRLARSFGMPSWPSRCSMRPGKKSGGGNVQNIAQQARVLEAPHCAC